MKTTADQYGIAPPSYRLPNETHLGRVRLQVADLDRSIAYYQNVIGFRVLERDGNMALLGPHNDDRVIVELRARAGVNPVARRGHIGLYHFAILLPDRAALGRFVDHLAGRGEYAGMSDHLVSEAVYLTDPDGLGIEVYADRPRSEWRVESGQLAMASIPLDVKGVVAAARGEKWSGAPAGTVLGHVHLYVRNLDEASAFYHAGLGLDKVVWGYPGALFMSAGGYHHHLGTNTWAANASLSTEEDARLLEWEVIVPSGSDVDAVATSLQRAGATVERENGDALASDPWGTRVRVRVP